MHILKANLIREEDKDVLKTVWCPKETEQDVCCAVFSFGEPAEYACPYYMCFDSDLISNTKVHCNFKHNSDVLLKKLLAHVLEEGLVSRTQIARIFELSYSELQDILEDWQLSYLDLFKKYTGQILEVRERHNFQDSEEENQLTVKIRKVMAQMVEEQKVNESTVVHSGTL